ncbi:hypothetical protein Pedsa_0591 [Pseudopedobacter saltans DSM 12145]|uniref:Uncharacterized protein n=1 Tax=Pseudopedobacter saltans (strain ATCC 51119 / DSM 12145 / JCM 21818 / CCUG 39354 / LMG 10337 / NBRC 100064 / NCIMB 13643) TaxID=762903 RepID=F0S7E4_PSESL|nr:hypothetical protein [Pseudopedobacter saltans]ADY51169.1 hypothetical protein Pedsa_0591 [Pseudopedobacter saltans DSM 12145]
MNQFDRGWDTACADRENKFAFIAKFMPITHLLDMNFIVLRRITAKEGIYLIVTDYNIDELNKGFNFWKKNYITSSNETYSRLIVDVVYDNESPISSLEELQNLKKNQVDMRDIIANFNLELDYNQEKRMRSNFKFFLNNNMLLLQGYNKGEYELFDLEKTSKYIRQELMNRSFC